MTDILPFENRRKSTSERPEPLDLVIGLDFGTSCSKVVVRSPWVGGGRAVAVPAPEECRVGEYLVPSTVHILEDHSFSLVGAPGARRIVDIKERLRAHPDDATACAAVAGYLACMMRYVMTWFVSTQSEFVGLRRPRWAVNIGVPSKGCSNNALARAFHAVGSAAFLLADFEKFDLIDCLTALDLTRGDGNNLPVAVVPEIAAEIVGYARSDARRDGMYVMLDVGAATLDVGCFRLYRNDEEIDEYAFFSTIVEGLGAEVLHRRRIAELESLGAPIAQTMRDRRGWGGSKLPDSWVEYFDAGSKEDISSFECPVDGDFAKECTKALMTVLMTVRRWKDQSAPEWEEGVPVFLCGGGVQALPFCRAVEAADERLRRRLVNAAGLATRTIPVPESMVESGIDADTFRRLAVAWGLSYDRFEIGEIVPPEMIGGLPPAPTSQWQDRYVGAELT